MKISWAREVSTQLRLPPVCAATGAPAARPVPMLFRNRYSYWLPGIGRLIMNLTSPYLMLAVPLSEEVRKKVMTWRLISLGSILGGLVLGAVLAAALRSAAGSGLFVLFLVAGLIGSVVARLRADVVGTDVNGHVISMRTAHPAFVQATLSMNPPGVFQVEGTPAGAAIPQQQAWQHPPAPPQHAGPPSFSPPNGYPPNGYPPNGSPQQPYPQPGSPAPQQPYPQDPYQQQPYQNQYPQPGYPQPGYPPAYPTEGQPPQNWSGDPRGR